MKIISLSQLPEEGVSHNPEIKKKVMLRKGEVPNLTNFSQALFKLGQAAGIHTHKDMYEIFFIENGRGIIQVEDKEYLVEKGFCIMVEPGESHDIINPASPELVVTYFGLRAEMK
jgi:mannose-6-phosphate isomerase-like protein (cupin superfamily)